MSTHPQPNYGTDLDSFLGALDHVAESLAPARWHDRFLHDLDAVYETGVDERSRSAGMAANDLRTLGRCFDDIRRTTVERLGGARWLEHVPAYDPLRCPIGLFTTLDLGLRETAHTSALAWLLNPVAEHGFRDELLRPFVRQVFGLTPEPKLSDVEALSEYPTTGERGRIDILVRGKLKAAGSPAIESFRVIIEAKIDADEGDDQCSRYEEYARATEHAGERLGLIFLTPNGRDPTSAGKRGPSRWRSISFLQLMALFREKLDLLQHRPGFPFLRLYMAGVLRNVCEIDCGRPNLFAQPYLISTYLASPRVERFHP